MSGVQRLQTAGLWPQLEDVVPPELPPEIAVGRLVALTRSLLTENRQLREALNAVRPTDRGALPELLETLRPTSGDREAA
jgi:hypothetical protein